MVDNSLQMLIFASISELSTLIFFFFAFSLLLCDCNSCEKVWQRDGGDQGSAIPLDLHYCAKDKVTTTRSCDKAIDYVQDVDVFCWSDLLLELAVICLYSVIQTEVRIPSRIEC
jgi:hypothetical protein